VTQARPGALRYKVLRPFHLSDGSLLPGDVFVVGGLDGVVRSNMLLRDSWTGLSFHFTVTVTLDDHVTRPHAANLTV